MKRSYTLRLFLLALGLFWLSLLFTIDLHNTSEDTDDIIILNYPEMDGVESIHFDHSLIKKNLSSIHSLNINYVDQPYISIELRGIGNKDAIQSLFKRDGNRLIFQPLARQPDKNALPEEGDVEPSPDDWWDIRKINLPLPIQHITAQGVDLSIEQKANNSQPQANHEAKLHLPLLDIQTTGNNSINIANIQIGTLKIHSRTDYTLCENDAAYPHGGGDITISDGSTIDHLLIESQGEKNIRLDNTTAIKSMALRTSPETGISLDRIDAYPRLKWEPLPTPARPECEAQNRPQQATSAASATAAVPQ